MDRPVDQLNPAQLRDRMIERLQELDRQLDALSRERQTLLSDLDVTDHFIDVWRRVNNLPGPERPRETIAALRGERTAPSSEKPKNPPRERVVDGALRLIQRAGRPMNRSELFDGLRTMGLEVFGKDPQMVLSTMLWRSQDRIVRLKDHGYWPKDLNYEPANYLPVFNDPLGAAATDPEGELEEPDDES